MRKGRVLSTHLFNIFGEYIMREAGFDQMETRVNIGGRNVNNLRYADVRTLTVKTEEDFQELVLKYTVQHMDYI